MGIFANTPMITPGRTQHTFTACLSTRLHLLQYMSLGTVCAKFALFYMFIAVNNAYQLCLSGLSWCQCMHVGRLLSWYHGKSIKCY